MLKKTITYKDFDGNEQTDTFYFHLTKAEILELETSEDQIGLSKYIEMLVEKKNYKEIIRIFKEIILKAYGEKSPDGKHFVKSQELRDSFSSTEAFSQLFMELATDANAAATFINSIIPAELSKN